MASLTAKRRKALPSSAFVYPSTRKYPIHDVKHARNALSRAAQKGTSGDYATVRRAVCARYPSLPTCRTGARKAKRRKR